MNKEQIQNLALLSEQLEAIYIKLNYYHLQYRKMVKELAQSRNEVESYYRNLLQLFTFETSGRSIEDGLSNTQIQLGQAFESLYDCMSILGSVNKKMVGMNKSVDKLADAYGCIGFCLEALEEIELEK